MDGNRSEEREERSECGGCMDNLFYVRVVLWELRGEVDEALWSWWGIGFGPFRGYSWRQ